MKPVGEDYDTPAEIMDVAPVEFSSGEPCNGRTGARLADFLSNTVRSLDGVGSVVDLGCGNGYLARKLLAAGYEVAGVDASPTGIAVAKKEDARGRFFVERIDAGLTERLSLKNVDCAISSDVIEHLYRPADLMECASGLLAPGGYLVVGTPYHGYLKNIALSLFDQWDAHHCVGWDGGHIKFFSVKTLRELVQRHGFTDLRFRFFGRGPYLWMNMLCIARKS